MPPPQSTEMKTGIRKRRTEKNCKQNKSTQDSDQGFATPEKRVRQTQRSMPSMSWQLRQRVGVHVQVTRCTSHNKENVEIVEGAAVVLRRGSNGDVSTEELSSSPRSGLRVTRLDSTSPKRSKGEVAPMLRSTSKVGT